MGTGFYPEVKRPEHGVDHRHPSRAELYKAWFYNSAFLLACSVLSWGDVYLFFYTFVKCAIRGTEINTHNMDSSIVQLCVHMPYGSANPVPAVTLSSNLVNALLESQGNCKFM